MTQAITTRLTYQIPNNNRLTALHERMTRSRQHRDLQGGWDPQTTHHHDTPLPVNLQAKLTPTISDRLPCESQISVNLFHRWPGYPSSLIKATCFTSFAPCLDRQLSTRATLR